MSIQVIVRKRFLPIFKRKKILSHFSFLKLNQNLPLRFVPVGNCDRTKFFLRFSMRWLLAREGYAQSTVPCTFAHIFYTDKNRRIKMYIDFNLLLIVLLKSYDWFEWLMIISIITALNSFCWIEKYLKMLDWLCSYIILIRSILSKKKRNNSIIIQ